MAHEPASTTTLKRPRGTVARPEALAAGSSLLASLMKGLARRPRPLSSQVSVSVAPLSGTSFPSGHVLSYVGTYGVLAYLLAARVRPTGARLALVAVPL